MKKYVKMLLFLGLFGLMLSLFSCKNEEAGDDSDSDFKIYYVADDSIDFYPVAAEIQEMDSQNMLISTVWELFKRPSEGLRCHSVVPEKLELTSCALDDYNLVFNFTASYNEMNAQDELLFRACLVRTFTQFNFVNTVEIEIESQPLTAANGNPIGPQKYSAYTDLIGNGLTMYQKETLVLYFSSPDGTQMSKQEITLTHSTKNPTEYYVVARLIMGPLVGTDYVRVLNSDCKILSVKTQNSICHVNLNSAFLDGVENVKPEVQIYAVVNALTELADVTSVQFTVNGVPAASFMDSVDISKPLKRDLTYVSEPVVEEPKN